MDISSIAIPSEVQPVLNEFLKTEQEFIGQMQCFVGKCNELKTSGLLTPNEREQMEKFLLPITQLLENAKIFANITTPELLLGFLSSENGREQFQSYLDSFIPCVAQFASFLHFLEQDTAKKTWLQQAFEEDHRPKDIGNYLSLPFQRVPRYMLLFKDAQQRVSKLTDQKPLTELSSLLGTTLELVSSSSDRLNESKRQVDQAQADQLYGEWHNQMLIGWLNETKDSQRMHRTMRGVQNQSFQKKINQVLRGSSITKSLTVASVEQGLQNLGLYRGGSLTKTRTQKAHALLKDLMLWQYVWQSYLNFSPQIDMVASCKELGIPLTETEKTEFRDKTQDYISALQQVLAKKDSDLEGLVAAIQVKQIQLESQPIETPKDSQALLAFTREKEKALNEYIQRCQRFIMNLPLSDSQKKTIQSRILIAREAKEGLAKIQQSARLHTQQFRGGVRMSLEELSKLQQEEAKAGDKAPPGPAEDQQKEETHPQIVRISAGLSPHRETASVSEAEEPWYRRWLFPSKSKRTPSSSSEILPSLVRTNNPLFILEQTEGQPEPQMKINLEALLMAAQRINSEEIRKHAARAFTSAVTDDNATCFTVNIPKNEQSSISIIFNAKTAEYIIPVSLAEARATNAFGKLAKLAIEVGQTKLDLSAITPPELQALAAEQMRQALYDVNKHSSRNQPRAVLDIIQSPGISLSPAWKRAKPTKASKKGKPEYPVEIRLADCCFPEYVSADTPVPENTYFDVLANRYAPSSYTGQSFEAFEPSDGDLRRWMVYSHVSSQIDPPSDDIGKGIVDGEQVKKLKGEAFFKNFRAFFESQGFNPVQTNFLLSVLVQTAQTEQETPAIGVPFAGFGLLTSGIIGQLFVDEQGMPSGKIGFKASDKVAIKLVPEKGPIDPRAVHLKLTVLITKKDKKIGKIECDLIVDCEKKSFRRENVHILLENKEDEEQIQTYLGVYHNGLKKLERKKQDTIVIIIPPAYRGGAYITAPTEISGQIQASMEALQACDDKPNTRIKFPEQYPNFQRIFETIKCLKEAKGLEDIQSALQDFNELIGQSSTANYELSVFLDQTKPFLIDHLNGESKEKREESWKQFKSAVLENRASSSPESIEVLVSNHFNQGSFRPEQAQTAGGR